MSASEIGHRLREQFRRHGDRLRFQPAFRVDDDPELDDLIRRNDSSLKTYIQEPARRFYASTQVRRDIANYFSLHHPEWFNRTIQQAAALCDHRVNLLAYHNVQIGANIDWHRDPISGFQWPREFCADYDLVNAPPADVKIIHELNRHQHLPRLAKAFFLTGDELYARESIAQIESWIDQNPKWLGVNWQSSLEIGIRSISWLWTLFLLRESQSLSEQQLRSICRSLFAQLDHVYRYPSTHTSPNTHLIGEAAALFIAGVLFPELPRARAWREFGVRTLIDEMKRQVLNDGMHAELSSYYHCYAADFYLHALVLARANGMAFPEWVWARFSGMLDVVMHLTRPDGTIPLLGDDDGGRVLALASGNYVSYRDGLCSGSVLFRRPDFKYQAAAFCEESFWLLGQDASEIFDSLDAEAPAQLHHDFLDSGYFSQRTGWGPNDTHVTFDCGGMGLGSGGHAHADALSLTLFTGGHEFLIDPGTSAYNCARAWRGFFRSTGAHNTVTVDERDQSRPGATFRWKTQASAHLRQRIALSDIDYIDGAVQFREITHRRRLVHIRPNYWIVLDELNGKGNHVFDFLYHFPPEARLTIVSDEKYGEIDCRVRIKRAGLQMCMYASDAIQAEVACGQQHPVQGWASHLYGERHESPVLKASIKGTVPVSMMSFLVPTDQPVQSRRLKGNTSHAIAAVSRNGEYDDIAVMSVKDGDLHLTDYVMRGEFFWMRTEQTKLRRLLAVNAYSFRWAGQTVFESEEMIPYVHVCFWDNVILIERGEQEGKVYVRDLRDRQFQRH
jgi:Heparinase II/III N-terminus/Heparinase II/III-like protein